MMPASTVAGIAAGRDDFVAFLDDAFHAFAGFAAGLFVQRLEDLFQTGDLGLGNVEMFLQRILQLGVISRVDQLGQCVGNLIFRVVQVAQFFQIKLLQVFQFH